MKHNNNFMFCVLTPSRRMGSMAILGDEAKTNEKINEEKVEGEMTLDDAIDQLGFGWFQIKLLFIAGKFFFLYLLLLFLLHLFSLCLLIFTFSLSLSASLHRILLDV